jgi:tetraacyldisaccharide 4'-kinase
MGWLREKELPCVVISVGNLTVGGTGKTPTTLWLAQEIAFRGHRVAILSHGYKRKSSEPLILEPGCDPIENFSKAGDEPLTMAALYGQRVGVGRKRYDVATRLLQDADVDVVLLDDGFQHRRLRRDLDLLLLGKDWKGWLLPAGPFREPRTALRRADRYLITGSAGRWQAILARTPGQTPCLHGSLRPQGLMARDDHRWVEVPLGKITGSKILAVSGIADATDFYQMIQEWGGKIVDTLEFRDHHRYSTKDWQRISRAARAVDRIITTEKDLVKLVQFPFARDRLYALRVAMVVNEGNQLIDDIEVILRAKRGDPGKAESVHG